MLGFGKDIRLIKKSKDNISRKEPEHVSMYLQNIVKRIVFYAVLGRNIQKTFTSTLFTCICFKVS